MSQFIIHAIRDVIPHQPEPYPKELVDYASSLYSHSKMKQGILPSQFEVARHHFAAYLAIEKLEKRLHLAEPSMDKIPVPRRTIRRAIVNFKNGLLANPSSQPNTPSKTLLSTPRKKKIMDESLLLTPVSTRKHVRSDEEDEDEEKDEENNDDGDYQEDYSDEEYYGGGKKQKRTPKSKNSKSTSETGLLTPARTPNQKRAYTPRKGTKLRSLQDRLQDISNEKEALVSVRSSDITTTTVISLCNKFYITKDITEHILKTYQDYRARFKSPWGLLCSIIALTYFKINRKSINTEQGFKAKFLNSLYLQQHGGLTRQELAYWINLIKNVLSAEKWLNDLDLTYADETEIPFGIDELGSMITPAVCFNSDRKDKEFKEWGNFIMTQLRIK